MSLHAEIAGEPGALIGIDQEILVVRRSTPLAPGQPVVVQCEVNDQPLSLTGRTIGFRREDSAYCGRIRLTNLRRAERSVLHAILGVG